MKTTITLIALGLALSFGAAQAQDKAKAPQPSRMANCNKEAVGKKGDERRAFMKSCLSVKTQLKAATP
ncbi:MAG: hypothetical protein EBY24_11475 [Betaproteobacteria bacterium]|nr:hypothetical protein [Betaproteobacteria bacterium]